MPVIFESPPDTPAPDTHQHAHQKANLDPLDLHAESSSLWSYIQKPKHVFFATQKPDETIILFIRQHPITQVPWILIASMLLVAPFLLVPLVLSMSAPYMVIPFRFIVVSIAFWYLATSAYIFISFMLWYYNINIVTNKRIIDIDFIYLLVQEVTTARLEQVEDVTYQRVGSFATVFDYGNVLVQTAGAEVKIEFLSVPKPKQISKIIIDLLATVQSSP